MKFQAYFILLLLTCQSLVFAKKSVVINNVFKNEECSKTDSCSLKRFNLKIMDYSFNIHGAEVFGTEMAASYETSALDSLEDYAVVQFIRGCSYNSFINNNGSVQKISNIARQFFDGVINFNHRDWVIDSIDKDPVYFSTPNSKNRHAYYKWNTNINSTDKKGQNYLFQKYPIHPKLYVTDIPSQASFSGHYAKNTNLEFRTCLYKTSDVPLETFPEDTNFATPLHCEEWQSSYIYDHNRKKYLRDQSIESTCSDLL